MKRIIISKINWSKKIVCLRVWVYISKSPGNSSSELLFIGVANSKNATKTSTNRIMIIAIVETSGTWNMIPPVGALYFSSLGYN
ncbi:MAG: hypothetical protein KQA36_02020, partial [Candidatus Aenigmarchaeota archaeon]|nr:hypothetical protein [Candidatus Aenigmarchaeota archaeon]